MKALRMRRLAATLSGALLLATAFVVLAVWVEARFPVEDETRALSPVVQRALTAPVADAAAERLGRIVQQRALRMQRDSGLTIEATLARFLDDTVDLSRRRHLAYRLAAVGSPECIAALRTVLATAAPAHRAFIAQLIGSTGNADAAEALRPLLDDADARVVMAAIRGLCAIGDENVARRVAAILDEPRYAERIRIEAALGLGTIRTPAARDALVRAFERTASDSLRTQILASLGQFDFSTVAGTFERHLAAPETPPDLRVVAVEALAHSSPGAVPFLLRLAGGDADAEVRASAAWAISAHQTVGNLGRALTRLAEREPEPDVRRRLYEALLPQSVVPTDRLLPLVLAEEDVAARVAGFNAIGRGAYQRPSSSIAGRFDAEIVPELLHVATASNSLNIQMRAVFALRRARTPASMAALGMIAERAAPPVATAARNGLRAASS